MAMTAVWVDGCCKARNGAAGNDVVKTFELELGQVLTTRQQREVRARKLQTLHRTPVSPIIAEDAVTRVRQMAHASFSAAGTQIVWLWLVVPQRGGVGRLWRAHSQPQKKPVLFSRRRGIQLPQPTSRALKRSTLLPVPRSPVPPLRD